MLIDIGVFFSASFLAMAAARDALPWRVDASSSKQSSSNVSISLQIQIKQPKQTSSSKTEIESANVNKAPNFRLC